MKPPKVTAVRSRGLSILGLAFADRHCISVREAIKRSGRLMSNERTTSLVSDHQTSMVSVDKVVSGRIKSLNHVTKWILQVRSLHFLYTETDLNNAIISITGTDGFVIPDTIIAHISNQKISIVDLIQKSSPIDKFFLDRSVIIVSATKRTVIHQAYSDKVEAVDFVVKF
ncbi:MAG: hypothetical protein JWO15_2304 [Sphingomonadales bacterium]|nr:hypothetical protein [Sphingomonadales bacterium]